MAKKQCGIIRISDARSGGKIKSKTQLKSRLMHNLRGDKLAGDARLWHLNHDDGYIDVLYGPDSVEAVMDDAEALYSRLDVRPTVDKGKMRDSVHAVELLLAYSPDFADNINQAQWEDDALAWLQKKYGKRLISVVCHKDESTPHVHALMIPIVKRKDGKLVLAANRFFDNERQKQSNGKYKVTRNRMEELQDDYHKNVSLKQGLKRGDKVSQKPVDAPVITHKHVGQWRKEQAASSFISRIKTPSELIVAKAEIAGMKRNLRREIRKAKREGAEDKAKELESTLNNIQYQVKALKKQNNSLFDSNAMLSNDLESMREMNSSLKKENEELLSTQAEHIDKIRTLNKKLNGYTK